MRQIIFSFFCLILASCTKEVQIDIPNASPVPVIDGRIETNGFPVLVITLSQNLYEPTNLGGYIQSNIYDIAVYIKSNGDSLLLNVFAPLDLPLENQITLCEMLSIELDQLPFFPVKVYSTTDASWRGVNGKSYTLSFKYKGSDFQATTSLLNPVGLSALQWIPDVDNTNYGLCLATLQDPANAKNNYRWESKLITHTNGIPKDYRFRNRGGRSFFNDQFINGLEISFERRYPEKDTTHPENYKRHFKLGDSLVVKFSRIDDAVFNYYDKRSAQQDNNGSPFATPVNIPSNLNNKGLGIWAGFSTWLDTLYCIP